MGIAPITYVLGGVVAIILLWLDGTISKSLAKGTIERGKSSLARNAINAGKAKLAELQRQLLNNEIDIGDFNRQSKEINKAFNAFLK